MPADQQAAAAAVVGGDNSRGQQAATAAARRRHATGLAYIFATAAIWIASSFISQRLVRPDPAGGRPQLPPLLLTYVCTAMFMLYLPVAALLWRRRLRLLRRRVGTAGSSALPQQQQRPPAAAAASSPWLALPAPEADELRAPLLAVAGDAPAQPAADAAHSSSNSSSSRPSWGRLARAAALVAPLWYCAQLAFACSLARTSVTSNTILSSSSALFTYGLSVATLGERATAAKAGSVALVMAGTAMVTLADRDSPAASGEARPTAAAAPPTGSSPAAAAPGQAQGAGGTPGADGGGSQSVVGDVLSVLSAALYACYTVLMRRLLGQETGAAQAVPGQDPSGTEPWLEPGGQAPAATGPSSAAGAGAAVGQPGGGGGWAPGGDAEAGDAAGAQQAGDEEAGDDAETTMRFFGLVGAIVAVALAPLLVAAQLLGWLDVRALPPSAIGLALLNGLLDYVLSDYFWARAVLLVGPTVATLGLSVQIPMATVADLFFGDPSWLHRTSCAALTAGGAAAIVAGFVGVTLAPGGAAVQHGAAGGGGEGGHQGTGSAGQV